MEEQNDSLNFIFAYDATGSMSSFLNALKQVFAQSMQLYPLFAPDAKYHLMMYRDFDCSGDDLYKYYGPFSSKDVNKMISVVQNTRATGGGDSEEAQKFAFGLLLREETIPVGEPTIVFHFTDAPPHSFPFPKGNGNHAKEGNALLQNALDQDWIDLCNQYKERGIKFYSIVGYNCDVNQRYYSLISQITGGELIMLLDTSVETILKTTIITGACALGYDDCNLENLGFIVKVSDNDIDNLPTAENSNSFKNFQLKKITFGGENDYYQMDSGMNICTRNGLENRYKIDPEFQRTCFSTFKSLLQSGHILSLTYNPLLGCLYRLMNRRSKVIGKNL